MTLARRAWERHRSHPQDGLVNFVDWREARPTGLVRASDVQLIRRLNRHVRPAYPDPEGERGLELLGAVFAGAQGFLFLR